MNIKDFLPFYLGCEVLVPDEDEPCILDSVTRGCIYVEGGCDYPFEKVKPILRPLSDITDQEKDEERKIWNSALIYPDPFTEIKKTIADAKATQYLLSKQLDVFGLIDAGLAIDKTKLNNQ